MASFPYYLANRPEQPNTDLEVTDKYSGEVAYRVAMADVATIDRAIGAAVDAAEPMRRMAPYERRDVLNHCVVRFQERFDELRCRSVSKPASRSRTRKGKSAVSSTPFALLPKSRCV